MAPVRVVQLTISHDTLAADARIGVRIDPATRSVQWIDVPQWVAWCDQLTDNHREPT
jgi:hypothetical protein